MDGYSHSLRNAQKLLEQRRAAAGIETRPLTWPTLESLQAVHTAENHQTRPNTDREDVCARTRGAAAILPPSPALSKTPLFLAKCHLVLFFVNGHRKGMGLPEIDLHGRIREAQDAPPGRSILAALQERGLDHLGQLWALMRAADPAGSGWLPKSAVYELLDISPANMSRILQEGEQAGFWRVCGAHLGYTSESRLRQLLGLTAVTSQTRSKMADLQPAAAETVKAYPSILAGCRKTKRVPAGRLWLLLRGLDPAGQGLWEVEEVKRRFCDKSSPRYLGFTERRLRQILTDGEGIFWDSHTDGRLWLRGAARVAAALGVDHLHGRPVVIPLSALLGSIKEVKAHFFASYESGRKRDTPLSQAALREATGAAERTQRDYNKLLARQVTTNYTVTSREYDQENVWTLAQEQDRPVLKFTDWQGKRHGKRRAAYCAYRLPDTRSKVHEQAPKGRQRQINRTLNLVNKRERGKSGSFNRVYHPSVEEAAKAYGRNPDHTHHWPLDKKREPAAARPPVSLWEGIG